MAQGTTGLGIGEFLVEATEKRKVLASVGKTAIIRQQLSFAGDG